MVEQFFLNCNWYQQLYIRCKFLDNAVVVVTVVVVVVVLLLGGASSLRPRKTAVDPKPRLSLQAKLIFVLRV